MKTGTYRGTWTDTRQPNKYRGKIEFNQNIDSWVSAYITFEGDYKRGIKAQYKAIKNHSIYYKLCVFPS